MKEQIFDFQERFKKNLKKENQLQLTKHLLGNKNEFFVQNFVEEDLCFSILMSETYDSTRASKQRISTKAMILL